MNEIWDTDDRIEVGTNCKGHLESKQRCNIPLLGKHWFNIDSMTNFIAPSDMTAKLRVNMDSSKERAFFVHLPEKTVKLMQMSNHQYRMNLLDPKSFISKKYYEAKHVQFVGVSSNSAVLNVKGNLQHIRTPTQ